MTPTPNSVRSTPVVGHQHRWLIAILSVAASTAFAQQGDGNDVPIKTHVFRPDKVPATDARIGQLKAPAGFKVTAFARHLKNVRILAVSPGGLST